MKKIGIIACIFMFLTMAVSTVQAETITIHDAVGDPIGAIFETYKIDINNFTPGVNSGAISFDIYTDYPQSGFTAGAWVTTPADLFITETYMGNEYEWAIPLINHGTFTAGTMYAVGSYFTSDDMKPATGSYIYNPGEKVQIASTGINYGFASFGGGSVVWNPSNGISDWVITVTTGIWQDDPNGKFEIFWGTGTCANDIITGSTSPIPEPATMMLFGIGLLSIARVSRKKA